MPRPKDVPRGFAARLLMVLLAAMVSFPAMAVDNAGAGEQDMEEGLRRMGMVDVREIDPTLRVDLMYAREDNFMHRDVYGGLKRCFLRPEPARMLKKANGLLRELHPGWSLLVLDGLRPNHIQQRMWDIVKSTPMQRYVAAPERGSLHGYGCAVDLTVADAAGRPLDMGTPVDHFGEPAQPRLEAHFLKEGKLTREQVDNRMLLRRVMTTAGFRQLPIEWWHFDAYAPAVVRARFSIIP